MPAALAETRWGNSGSKRSLLKTSRKPKQFHILVLDGDSAELIPADDVVGTRDLCDGGSPAGAFWGGFHASYASGRPANI